MTQIIAFSECSQTHGSNWDHKGEHSPHSAGWMSTWGLSVVVFCLILICLCFPSSSLKWFPSARLDVQQKTIKHEGGD